MNGNNIVPGIGPVNGAPGIVANGMVLNGPMPGVGAVNAIQEPVIPNGMAAAVNGANAAVAAMNGMVVQGAPGAGPGMAAAVNAVNAAAAAVNAAAVAAAEEQAIVDGVYAGPPMNGAAPAAAGQQEDPSAPTQDPTMPGTEGGRRRRRTRRRQSKKRQSKKRQSKKRKGSKRA